VRRGTRNLWLSWLREPRVYKSVVRSVANLIITTRIPVKLIVSIPATNDSKEIMQVFFHRKAAKGAKKEDCRGVVNFSMRFYT
jgi:hypothetical protein